MVSKLKVSLLCAALGSLLACGTASATDGGPIMSISHGKGFNCGSGLSWVMVSGVATCSNATATSGSTTTSAVATSQTLGPASLIEWVDLDTTADNATKPYTSCTTSGSSCTYMAASGATVTATLTNSSSTGNLTVTAAPAIGTAVYAAQAAYFTMTSTTCTAGLVLAPGASCTSLVKKTATGCYTYAARLNFTTSLGTSYITLEKTYLSSACSSSSGSIK